MITRLTNFGALTPEDYEIVHRRFTRQDSQYVRNQMRDGDFESARVMNALAKARVSNCGATEDTETDRNDRLRDRPV